MDTLYFYHDNDYIFYNKGENIKYADLAKWEANSINKTGTNGYVSILKDTIFIDLKPKKIHSLKKYIEKREFYYPGAYNKIVDNEKLKDSFINKHVIFIVRGNEFIKPKYIRYNSYYPIGKGENAKHNTVQDTLYFKYDDDYLVTYDVTPYQYYSIDNNKTGVFYFEKKESHFSLKPKKKLSLKKYIRKSKFYRKNLIRKLDDYGLSQYLQNYTIFFIKKCNGKTEYIRVEPVYAES